MVATLTSIYRGEKSLPIRGICARYRGGPARINRWQNNGSSALPAEYFRKGVRAIGTFSEKHWAVRCCARAVRSHHYHFCLERTILLVYELAVTQLVLPRLLLISSFLLIFVFSVRPFLFYRKLYHTRSDASSHTRLHPYIVPPMSSYTLSSVE